MDDIEEYNEKEECGQKEEKKVVAFSGNWCILVVRKVKRMQRVDQITIKISRTSYEWLKKQKQKTGVSIRFLIDEAVDRLKKVKE